MLYVSFMRVTIEFRFRDLGQDLEKLQGYMKRPARNKKVSFLIIGSITKFWVDTYIHLCVINPLERMIITVNEDIEPSSSAMVRALTLSKELTELGKTEIGNENIIDKEILSILSKLSAESKKKPNVPGSIE